MKKYQYIRRTERLIGRLSLAAAMYPASSHRFWQLMHQIWDLEAKLRFIKEER